MAKPGMYEGVSDEELLIAWKQGEQNAGAALLMRYHHNVARFFIHKLGNDSEDLVQATFLGLLEGFDRFRGESSFRTYLFGIARNKLLMAITERVRDRKRFDPGVTSIAALDLTPTKQRAIRDQQKLLLAALRSLPLDVQIMLELHYWERMKVDDIAEVLDMNRNTVRTKMRRGRQRLHDEMQRLSDSKQLLETTLDGLAKWAARLREELGEAEETS